MAIEFDLWLSWHFSCSKNRRWCIWLAATVAVICGKRVTVCDAFVHTVKWLFRYKNLNLNFILIATKYCVRFNSTQWIFFNLSVIHECEKRIAKFYYKNFLEPFNSDGIRWIEMLSFVFKRVETQSAQCQTGRMRPTDVHIPNADICVCRRSIEKKNTHTHKTSNVYRAASIFVMRSLCWQHWHLNRCDYYFCCCCYCILSKGEESQRQRERKRKKRRKNNAKCKSKQIAIRKMKNKSSNAATAWSEHVITLNIYINEYVCTDQWPAVHWIWWLMSFSFGVFRTVTFLLFFLFEFSTENVRVSKKQHYVIGLLSIELNLENA